MTRDRFCSLVSTTEGCSRKLTKRLRVDKYLLLALLLTAPLTISAERAPSAVSPVDEAKIASDRELRLDYLSTPLFRIELPIADSVGAKQNIASEVGPLQIGFHRSMPEEYAGELKDRLYWFPGDDDTIVAALTVNSPGAAAMRVALRLQNLGEGEIRFFGERSGTIFVLNTQTDVLGNKDIREKTTWSPVVDGETVGIEIVLPSSEALRAFAIEVEKISHIHTTPSSSKNLFKEADCANQIDVQCRDDVVHDGYEDSVALIYFEKGSSTLLCTGTLLNDTVENSFIPYFITANHCISSQSVAGTIAARWFYQRAVCGDGEIDDRYIQSAGGADLLATSEGQDQSLLRLRGRLPGGLTYAGWNSETLDHPTDVYGIHHPGGDLKKYAEGATAGVEESLDGEEFDGFTVDWYEGVTEGGSSGSGMFRKDDGSLIGTLFGGKHDCYTAFDIYGSFADFFPSARAWLNPDSDSEIADDYSDTPASATTLLVGVVRQGKLERDGDIDYFMIELATAGSIQVFTTGTTDTKGVLFRDDGRIRIEDDNSGDGDNFLISLNVPAGTYYIEVRGDADATGDYSLEVSFEEFDDEGDHPDTRGAATNVATESSTDGELDWSNDLDYYRIEIATSGELKVETTGTTDTKGALLAENGNVLAEDDDSGPRSNFRIEHDVSPGTYFVEVRGFDADETGTYTLVVNFTEDEALDDHSDNIEDATDTSIPAIVEASLERDGDVDYFRIELAEDALLWVETSGGIDTNGTLLDEAGETLQEDNLNGEPLMIAADLAAATYYIEVRGTEDFTSGDYVLSIKADVSGRSGTYRDAATVEVPSFVSEELEHAEQHFFRVDLAAPGKLRLETSGITDTYGRLLDSQGKLLTENDDAGPGFNFFIEEVLARGSYFVEVTGAEFDGMIATGPYTLEFAFEEFSPNAVDVQVPSSTEGQLETGELDFARIQLTRAGDLRIETTGELDTTGRLLDEHGDLLSENDGRGTASNFRIDEYLSRGTYYIEISGGSESVSGSYTLEVSFEEFSPEAVALEVPSSTRRQLEAGARNHFDIELTETGILRVETSGATRTFCRLLNTNGDVLAESAGSGFNANCELNKFVSPASYYLEISGITILAAGAYTLETSFDTPLAIPSSTPAEFTRRGEEASFLIEISQSGMLVAAAGGELDTVARLLDLNGAVLAENDDDGEGLNFAIKHMLTPGHYILETREFDGDRGAYALYVFLWTSSRRLGDMDGDGRADVLLRHLDGRWSLHGMNGSRQSSAQELTLTRNRNWRWNFFADLNLDGNDDLLLRHADERFLVQAMNGPEIVADGSGALPLPRGTDWTSWFVGAVGEFLGPGDSKDLLLRNGDGRWRQYNIHGFHVTANNWPGLPYDLKWQVVGVLDKTDLLLRHIETGEWQMMQVAENETTVWRGSDVTLSADLDIVPVGIGDLNGDGDDDLLLRQLDGRWEYRAMDSGSVDDAQSGETELEQDTNWRLAGIGDLNGDGKEDVLLRHVDGRWHYYAMDGRKIVESESGAADLPSDTDWSVPPVVAP